MELCVQAGCCYGLRMRKSEGEGGWEAWRIFGLGEDVRVCRKTLHQGTSLGVVRTKRMEKLNEVRS